MLHLVNVGEEGTRRYRTGKVFSYDSLLTGGLPRLIHYIYFPDETNNTVLQQRVNELRIDHVRNVRTRYILIEE